MKMMKKSVFCVDTTGDDLTTRRITSAVLSGCIPVLLCDDCVFPYPKLFPYEISSSFDQVFHHTTSTTEESHRVFPVFYIRLSVSKILEKHPFQIIEILLRILEQDDSLLLHRLQRNLLQVQSMFLSMLEPSSTFMEAMMSEMALSLSPKWIQTNIAERFECRF